MKALVDIYRAQIRKSLILQFQYRVAMMIWMIEIVVSPVIYLVVWSTVARSSGGSVGGFSAGDFAAYYILLMVVTHATQIWHMWEYEYNIRAGILSAKLLRPIHPIHEDIAANIAYKILMLMVLIPAVIVLVLVFQPTLNPPLWAIFTFLPAVLLAAAVSFLAGWMLAMAAFWTTRIFAINQLYFVAMFFFSGQIAPLEIMPPAAQVIATMLPFRWILGFPVELVLGRLTPEGALTGLMAQVSWLVVLLAGIRLVWRAAVRRYSAVGA
jgi:ABC-2 type transport system permease protein